MTKQRKAWERTSFLPRPVNRREVEQTFLIVCEGKQTEPNYFNSFRVRTATTVTVKGIGANTVSLVREALQLTEGEDYDQVWCVFDRDSFPAKNFNDALTLAQNNNIEVAYSNQAFELWFLLHFNYYDAAMSRASYIERLSGLLGHPYEKNSPTIYNDLKDKQADAIKNAERLLSLYVPSSPARDDPSTTVHLLVQELNKFVD
ncbi:MAG: RloB family protein [Pyrinomonadaceae bacterium MAG19_C2-C3]|nr:RloB family protein [Pyrinomonadaceae bacterium MAG19_C2-C3]